MMRLNKSTKPSSSSQVCGLMVLLLMKTNSPSLTPGKECPKSSSQIKDNASISSSIQWSLTGFIGTNTQLHSTRPLMVYSKTWLFQLLKQPDKNSFSIFTLKREEVCSMLVQLVLERPLSSRITSVALTKMSILTHPSISITTLTPKLFKSLLNLK